MNRVSIVAGLALASLVVAWGGAALAQEPSRSLGNSSTLLGCSSPILRSSGYRDLVARFPSRQATSDALRAARAETSYRDASLRHPTKHRPALQRVRGTLPRYALQPPAPCG
jgi:hypothetical protein